MTSFLTHDVISPSGYAIADRHFLSNMNYKIPNVQNCEIVTNQNFEISQKKVLDSRETSPKWVSYPKSVKKIHTFQKKKGEPCVSLERSLIRIGDHYIETV